MKGERKPCGYLGENDLAEEMGNVQEEDGYGQGTVNRHANGGVWFLGCMLGPVSRELVHRVIKANLQKVGH